MWRACSLPPEDLIAYADGDLDPERHAEVASHLKTCAVCRERLTSSEEIGQMLRAHYPAHDNPVARAEIMRQVREIAARREQPAARSTIRWWTRMQRWPAAAAACLLLMLVVGVGLPMTTEADFRLGRFVSFVNRQSDSGPRNLQAGQEPPGTPITVDSFASTASSDVSFHTVEPALLPGNLELIETTTPDEYMFKTVYTDNAGTIVEILQQPALEADATFPDSGHVVETVRDTEVLIHRNPAGSYGRAIWERDGVIFDLLVLRWVGSGLGIDGIVEIAATFIEEQMAQ